MTERTIATIENLTDTNHLASAIAYRNRQDAAGAVAGFFVDCFVESVILVSVVNYQVFAFSKGCARDSEVRNVPPRRDTRINREVFRRAVGGFDVFGL